MKKSMKFKFNLFLALFTLITIQVNAQLTAGDIAIIGMNSDTSPDEFAIVTLADIPSGQTIYISDYGWDGAAFATASGAEGAIIWTTTSSIPAGTLLNFTISSPAGTPIIIGDLSTYGTVSATGWTLTSSAVASGGDNWFIYQGPSPISTPSNWVFGWANWSTDAYGPNAWQTTGTPSSTTSYLPSALTNGTDAIALTGTTGGSHADNMVYLGTTSGDKATILSSITNIANWSGSETVTQDISAGGSNFPGSNPIFSVLASNTAPTASSFTASNGPYESLTYTFATADFGYSDVDGDPLNHLLIEAIPASGTLYVDANNNDTYNAGEEVAVSDQVSKANLDAGNLQYIQNGSTNTSFQFEVNDGIVNSSGNYIATLNVLSIPTVTLSVSPGSKSESVTTTNTVTATLSNTYGANTTVSLAFSGTATNTVDYNRSASSIAITAGSTTGSVTLSNINDALYENDETVVIDISSVTNGTESGTQQVTYTITNDDTQPTASLILRSIYNPITDESGGQAYIVASLSAVSGVTTFVPLSFSGTATGGGTDYSITSSVITLSPGEGSDSIRVTSIFDGIEEGNETIVIDMNAPTNATENGTQQVTLTIIDEDAAPPTGYSATIDQSPINAGNESAVSFTFVGAEVGATYNYTFSSSGGGANVTGSGTIATATDQITGIDLSGLGDGTITLSVTLTDTFGNTGSPATDTKTKDTTPPTGYSVAFDQAAANAINSTAMSFTFTSAEVGATYNYTISSSGGGTNVTGSGTIATATDQITGIDLSGLGDGTLTLSVTLIDGFGNNGIAVTDNISKDAGAPSGYSVTIDLLGESIINVVNESIIEFTATGLEVGATLNYSFTSDGGGAPVAGTETVSSVSQTFNNSGAGYNLSGLGDGTITLTISLSDAAGNTGSDAIDSQTKDAGPPSGYTVAWDDVLINAIEAPTASFTVSNAEIGATINNTVASSGDGNTATVSNPTIVTSNTQVVTIDVSSLVDGVLTVQVSLTDGAGNTGSLASDNSAILDQTAPSGYSITVDQSAINATNQTVASFTFAGAEVGATYNYTFSSSGGGANVTGSGTIATATDQITGIDLSGLGDGTVTLSVTLTDPAGNTGGAATDNILKDASAPVFVSVDDNGGDNSYSSGESLTIVADLGETGLTVTADLSVINSGLSTTAAMTDNGDGTYSITIADVDVSGNMIEGTNTAVPITATDATGNQQTDNSLILMLDKTAPTGYSVTFDQAIINSTNHTAVSFTFAGAEVGATYNYTFSSSGGGTNVTGSGTITIATDQIIGIDLSGLGDGTVTLSVTLTDPAGNAGAGVTDNVSKDTSTPIFYSVDDNGGDNSYMSGESLTIVADLGEIGLTVTADLSVINSGLSATAAMTDNGDGTYSITIADVDVSGKMIEGASTSVSITATDGAGNQQTDSSLILNLDKTAPSGYSVSIDQAIINATNQTALSFTFAGAEVGTTYDYTISSSGGGTNVVGSGTVSSVSDQVVGIDVSGLNDGTLTLTVTLTDVAGNVGSPANNTVNKTTVTVQFNITSSNGDESVANASLQVDLSAASNLDITVDYTISGTATGGGTDYTLANGTLTIIAGNTSGSIVITNIVDDNIIEGDENVIVTLSNPTNATLGTNTVHTYTIVDNDAKLPQAITFDMIPDKTLGTGPVTLVASSDSGLPITFSISTQPATGVASLSGSSVILEGVGTVSVTASQPGNNVYDPAADVTQTFNILASELFLPTLFTPNGDGTNDQFILRGNANVADIELNIFDREGNLVFSSSNINDITQNGWNGKRGGSEQPQGAYVWVIRGTLTDGSPILINGKDSGIIKLAR